jgi:rubrerythrin
MSANKSDNSQGDTGTRDVTYDLLSVAYHALQGAETTALYIADAEQEGNKEVAQFFREAKEEYQSRAQRAKELLTTHLGRQQGKGAAGGGKK